MGQICLSDEYGPNLPKSFFFFFFAKHDSMDINLKISLFEKMSLEKMIFSVKNVFWKYDIYVWS